MGLAMTLKGVLRVVKYLVLLPLYWIACTHKKDDNLWIFGAWSGLERGDNSEAFYRHIVDRHPEINAVWLTTSRQVYHYFRTQGWKVRYANSPAGVMACWRARVGLLNCSKTDLNRYCLCGTELIQLWHGAPFKKIESDSVLLRDKENKDKTKWAKFPFLKDKFRYVISPSLESVRPFASAFKVPEEDVLVTGYPRNDVLLRKPGARPAIINSLGSDGPPEKVILYAPTFRDSNMSSLQIFESFDTDKMNELLDTHGAILVIKAHLLVARSFQELDLTSDRIRVATPDDIPDLNPFFPHVDILITDYSSMFFDFLLLDRPIVFAPFDLESYLKKDREMYYDYDRITPGPKAHNWPDVISCLEEALRTPQLFGNERAEVRKRFNQYCDDKSSERLYRQILTKLFRADL